MGVQQCSAQDLRFDSSGQDYDVEDTFFHDMKGGQRVNRMKVVRDNEQLLSELWVK